ncbi:acetyl/propionyl/methylcrotonyl-CoA carboxylase subunit alpha [Rhodobacteraceae bacterium]|nr:acetyl/propionyl/methylcrotonyl-CoA carboxylase subunit alpha [Paracoccaceae bacterium]
MFKKILIANRGEIACRVMKTCARLGIKTVAVFSDIDRNSLHVQMADESINIGSPEAKDSYLAIDKIISACELTGADAVHPGYGFLSENAKFCQALCDAGITFIGPPASAIEAMGDKITSKKIAMDAGVSTVPGFLGEVKSGQEAVRISNDIGYPVMIKASAGGGGKGMRVAFGADEVLEGFGSSQNEAEKSFGDNRIFIEKYITQPRHIEIQILGDTFGNYLFFGERECSIQRRNQKIIEEAPSPFLSASVRKKMGEQAVALAKSVNYYSVGTVEFIVDSNENFFFLEMNTRLQVEHPVTELVYGVDLVEEMIKVAANQYVCLTQEDIKIKGWAIESRIYAEDPFRNFLPSVGRLTKYAPPTELDNKLFKLRNDTGVYEGSNISIYYDPMIAKLCVWADDRKAAIEGMRVALDDFDISGVETNLPFLSVVMENAKFEEGNFSTAFISEQFPDGFDYLIPDYALSKNLSMLAACILEISMVRAIPNFLMGDSESKHKFLHKVATVGDNEIELTFCRTDEKLFVFNDSSHNRLCVEIDWSPGQSMVRATIGEVKIKSKIRIEREAFIFSFRGYKIRVYVRRPRIAELAKFMVERLPEDVSRLVLCPMPGLLVGLAVAIGDRVIMGQELCTVEAMKMENVLKAEKNSVVKFINKNIGDSLGVDDVIMEFE